MFCDVCTDPLPVAVLETGPIVLATAGTTELDATAWRLCAVCEEAVRTGNDAAVRMYARINNANVSDGPEVLDAIGDLAAERIAALRMEYLAGAVLHR